MKRYLFVMRRSPHDGSHLQETLDAILTAAAFDQRVSLLFVDEGVWQLKQHQQPELLGLKDTAAIFNALEVYDVKDLYIESESMIARGLQTNDLILPATSLPRREISNLMRAHDVIIPD